MAYGMGKQNSTGDTQGYCQGTELTLLNSIIPSQPIPLSLNVTVRAWFYGQVDPTQNYIQLSSILLGLVLTLLL